MSGHSNNNQQPETSKISAKPILGFLAGLVIMCAVTFFLIKGLLKVLPDVEDMNPKQPVTAIKPPDDKLQLPPEPLLQGAPGPGSTEKKMKPTLLPLEDMAKERKKVDELASSYSWIDKENGIARIPLDDAKKIIAERGLPVASEAYQQEIKKAAQVRKEMMNAVSSAGRNIQ